MNRKRIGGLAALAVGAVLCAPAFSQGVPETVRALSSSVVALILPLNAKGETGNGDGPVDRFMILGAGFYLADGGRLATAAHLLQGYPYQKVLFMAAAEVESSPSAGAPMTKMYRDRPIGPVYLFKKDASVIPADVIKSDSAGDAAVLRPSFAGPKNAAFGNFDKLDVGEDVVYMGFPFGYNRLAVHRGMISYKGDVDSIRKVQIDGLVNPGDSGGPLIAVKQKKIVGIVQAKDSPARMDAGYAASARYIERLAKP